MLTGTPEQLGMDPVDVLSFLFMLGSLELGRDYSTTSLTATQKQMLVDLEDFGIVYTHSNDPTGFYPTRLSTTLTSDAGALLVSPMTSNSTDLAESTAAKGGYII